MGSSLVFWFLCMSVIGIPVAILYLVNGTIRVEEEVSSADEFIAKFRAGQLGT
jgi:hypothetical protein